jgi:hypothetical protein
MANPTWITLSPCLGGAITIEDLLSNTDDGNLLQAGVTVFPYQGFPDIACCPSVDPLSLITH